MKQQALRFNPKNIKPKSNYHILAQQINPLAQSVKQTVLKSITLFLTGQEMMSPESRMGKTLDNVTAYPGGESHDL